MTKEETEALCGFAIPDEIWDFTPWGNRILVKRLPPEQNYGCIEIPQSAQRQVSAGIIVKVGHEVGYAQEGGRGSVTLPPEFWTTQSDTHIDYAGPDQDSLIGLLVTIGHWTGEAIHPSQKHTATESSYDTEWILIQAIDIWGHNGHGPYGLSLKEGKETQNDESIPSA